MLGKYSEYIENLYDRADSVLIIDARGYVEYSATYDHAQSALEKDNYIGKHILEVYPSLTEESSTYYRVMRSNEPIINERQNLVDAYGNSYSFINSTFPITIGDSAPMGVIEISTLVSRDHTTGEKASGGKNADFNKRKNLYRIEDIITNNAAMQAVKNDVSRLAQTSSSVMIYGETGTGKELIAESLHTAGSRKGPFITVNCSAMPSSIFESLLFGTKKGSFTGAEDKKGLMELADGGTLFLDELNSMDVTLQPKLLKAIEQRRFRRVGGEKEIDVNVRFITAMNIDPQLAVESGILRSDLYYRLAVIELYVPPLRKRPEDIMPLIKHYIEYYNRQLGKNVVGLTELAKNTLIEYDWPGNVRELRNVIEYAVNLSTGSHVTLQELPTRIVSGRSETSPLGAHQLPGMAKGGTFSLQERVSEYEKNVIMSVLKNSRSITQAAKKMQLTRQALQYKMQKYGLEFDE